MYTYDTKEHLIRALASVADAGELKEHSYDALNAAAASMGSCIGEYGSPAVEKWVIRAELGIDEPIDAIRVLRDLIPASELDRVDLQRILESRQTFLDYAGRDDISTYFLRQVMRARLGCFLTKHQLRWLAIRLLSKVIPEDELRTVSAGLLLRPIQAYLEYQSDGYWPWQFVCEIMRVRLGLEVPDDAIRQMAHRLIGGLVLSTRLERLSPSQVHDALIVYFEHDCRHDADLVPLIEARIFRQDEAALWPPTSKGESSQYGLPTHGAGLLLV